MLGLPAALFRAGDISPAPTVRDNRDEQPTAIVSEMPDTTRVRDRRAAPARSISCQQNEPPMNVPDRMHSDGLFHQRQMTDRDAIRGPKEKEHAEDCCVGRHSGSHGISSCRTCKRTHAARSALYAARSRLLSNSLHGSHFADLPTRRLSSWKAFPPARKLLWRRNAQGSYRLVRGQTSFSPAVLALLTQFRLSSCPINRKGGPAQTSRRRLRSV